MGIKYKPINYKTWDFSGQGKNILPLLQVSEKKLWQKAFPYQDTRKGEKGHAEMATYLALQLLNLIPAKREIVIPAIILHDIGWSQLTPEEHELFYSPEWEKFESQLRARHQEESVRLSRKLLQENPNTSHILEIISKHDTRKGFYSIEDGIVRSADRL